VDSPYHPGFGARPAVLVGRDQQLARAAASLTRVANSRSAAPSAMVLTGARGLGKTVTLGVVGDTATERGFVTVSVAFDSVSDNVQLLAGRVAEAIAPMENRRATEVWARFRQRLASLSIEVNAGVVKIASPGGLKAEGGQTTVQRQVLADLLAGGAQIAAAHDHAGLAIFLDELQEAPRQQLVVIANAIQDALAAAAAAPLAVFAAGLPQTPERVMAAASFTERFDYRVLDRLDRAAAERALVEPALALKVTWEPAAAAAVLESSGGSPYLIQLLGEEAWVLANPDPGAEITTAHAATAIEEVQQSLAAGMFRGRWGKATAAERDLMVAIAQVVDGDGIAKTRHITAVLGKTTPQLSTARKALIDKGLIESTGTGLLRFTMPGFAEFVRQHVDAPWYGPQIADGQPFDPEVLTAAPPSQIQATRPRELPTGDQGRSRNDPRL
jgi:hypothetical protein